MSIPDAGNEVFHFRPIGVIHTPFRQKFGIPRQSGLVDEAVGRLQLLPPVDRPEALKDLEGFSHIWLIWAAHRAVGDPATLTVRPPRLGGNRRVGVFASRSPFRPNSIGLSAVRLLRVEAHARPPALVVGGVDLLDGTPILDIKPYLPYADAIPAATGGFAPTAPPRSFDVRFSERAEAFLAERADGGRLRTLVTRLLELDPRPAYREEDAAEYAFRLEELDVRWRVDDDRIEVVGFVYAEAGPD
jgi:tRNA-Thr(GGU) m(6)t(6)A37 methyltransferase TsaA